MMTDSQKSFVKVKLWFSKLVNHKHFEQMAEIKKLVEDGTIDEAQVKLLKEMLQADSQTGMATSASGEGVSEAISDNQIINQQIGPYKIIKPIGEGGMGQVYLAERNDGVFEQQVALKLPHSSFNPQMLQRFENERQILAQLTHNNIAHLLDGGTTQNNQSYLVMEYIQGKNIDDYCIEKIPSLHERLKLILQICSAVAFSHQQLVLHRDLKPSNILVTDDGQVKLLDFGIAKLLDLDEETKAKVTATQIMTRYYASPEQLQGKPASTHSDLFSLAIIAYELITGYHPFQHETQHEREKNLISGKIMRVTQRTDDSEALSPELAKIASGKIQGDLENILLKALSVEPNKRYVSVKDFSDDLNNFIDNKPVTARKASSLYTLTKLIQRNKAITLAIVLTFFTLIGSTVFSLHKAQIAKEQKILADLENIQSKQISEILLMMFDNAKPKSGKNEVSAQDLLDQGFVQLNKNKLLAAKTRYKIILVLLNSYFKLGKMNDLDINVHYKNCIESLSKANQNCLEIMYLMADFEMFQKNNKKALGYIYQVEKIVKQQVPINNEFLLEVLLTEFNILTNLDERGIRDNKMKEASQLLSKFPKIESTKAIRVLVTLSYNAIFKDEFSNAEGFIKRLHVILIKNNLEKTEHMARYFWILGTFYSSKHQQKEAYENRAKAVQLILDNFPVQPKFLGKYISAYGRSLYRAGEFRKGLVNLKLALSFMQNLTMDTRKQQINIYIKISLIEIMLNNIDSAHSALNSALSIGIDNFQDTKAKRCYIKTAVTQLSIFTSDLDTIHKNMKDFKKCLTKKDIIIFKVYEHVINAQFFVKTKEFKKAKLSLDNAEKILNNYPEDYFGLKKMVTDNRVIILRKSLKD